MQEAPRRNDNKTFGLSASKDVKGGGSTAENPNPFKSDTESVENGYVKDIHCFACSSTDSSGSDPDGEKWKILAFPSCIIGWNKIGVLLGRKFHIWMPR